MADYIIKRGVTDLITVSPIGWQTKQAMGARVVDMEFNLTSHIEFQKGDWCTVYGERYEINILPTFVKTGERRFAYTVQLEHESYRLREIAMMGLDSSNNLTEPVHVLSGDAASHMALWLLNANRISSGWTLGVIEASELKVLEYKADSDNLLAVLNRLASEFETEYWIENKTVHLTKRTGDMGLSLGYGKGKGFTSVKKTNKDNVFIATRLWVEGGETNIEAGYRGGKKALQLPSGDGYIQDSGLVSQYGVIEAYAQFPDIYPKRTGTITSVTDILTFVDSAMDFDLNDYLVSGAEAKVVFKTGLLAGYEFTLQSYTHATKTFVINQIEDEVSPSGFLPYDGTGGGSAIEFDVADTYTLVNINMPSSYVTAAENELEDAAEEYYPKISDPEYNDKFEVVCDRIYFKANAIVPTLGYSIDLYETNPPIDVSKRISTIKRSLENAWDYELELTDNISLSPVALANIERQKVRTIIYGVNNGTIGGGGVATGFLGTLSGDSGYLYISGTKVKAGHADTATEATHAYSADLATLADTARNVQSSDFSTGMAGEGHRLLNGDLELNNINVRGTLSAYEFLVRKVKSVGGSFVVSGGAKVKEVVSHSGSTWTMKVEEDLGIEFEQYDIVICQNFNGTNQKYYKAVVTGTTSDTFTIDVLSGAGVPDVGDEIVQIDNTSDVNRKGMLYLTNSDSGAPFLDVVYGYHTDPSNRVKVRLGKLDGITDADFGALSGWGLYGDNVYLKNGKFKGQVTVMAGSNVYTKDEIDTTILDIDTELDNYANDDKLTPAEKLSIKILYDAAANEKEDYKTQGTNLGLSVTDYNSAYNALDAYVSPLLTDMTIISDIDGATLRSKFYNYGVEKSLLIKAIQAKQKELTDRKTKNFVTTPTNYVAGDTWTLQSDTIVNGVQYRTGDMLTASAASASYNQAHWTKQIRYGSLDDAKVGAYNLIDRSAFVEMFPNNNGMGTSVLKTDEADNYYRATPDSGKNVSLYSPSLYTMSLSKQYVASIYVRHFRGSNMHFAVYVGDGNNAVSFKEYSVPSGVWFQINTRAFTPVGAGFVPVFYTDINDIPFDYKKVQLVEGNIAVDWSPSLADIDDLISDSVNALEDYVDGAFEDGVIEQAEAKAIEKYINVVNETYEQLTQQYSVVYADPLLTGTPKTNLATAKSNLDTAKGNLISSINTAIADGKTTGAEKSDVDSKYATFKTRIGEYTTASENAYKSITDAINANANSKNKTFTLASSIYSYNAGDRLYPSVTQTIDGKTFTAGVWYETKTTSSTWNAAHWNIADSQTALTTAQAAQTATGNLSTYIDGAFKDGVIDTAEAKAIEKYTNIVNETYEQLISSYNVVYNDPLLTGTPKTNLATAKTNLDSSKNSLINSINTAISDGKTTVAEKTAVDNAYTDFKTKIGAYTTAVENAYKSITDAINANANSKAKTHYTNPPTNYNTGEFWIPQSNYVDAGTTFYKDNIYRATNTSASFNKAHWVKATSYTDDTVANTKTTTYIGATSPTATKVGDTWYNTTNKKWNTWDGSSWVIREDKVVGYIKAAIDESTEITGGLILSTIMAVKTGGVVKAYMSAEGTNPYAFAAGVSDFGGGSEARMFGVKHNGDIEIKYDGADRLKFVASTGVLTINGTVNATSGTIGGFTIESTKIKSGTPSWENPALVLDKASNSFEFYGGYQTSDNTSSGTIKPDIKIQTSTGFNYSGSRSIGEIRFGGQWIDGNRDATVIGGNGILSNCSNTSFVADISGIEVNIGSVNSRTYGGYFNSLFAGSLQTGVLALTSSTTYYVADLFFTTIHCLSGSSGSWIMLPSINHEEGRIIMIRNNSGGGVYISRTSSENLYKQDGTSATSLTIDNKGFQCWQRLNNSWQLLFYHNY